MKQLIRQYLVVFLLLSGLAGYGQTIKEEVALASEKNMLPVWNENDPNFTPNQVPKKWDGFSGVIIAQKTKFVFDKASGADKLNVFETGRRKIKLQDKGAVGAYSEFYFRRGHPNDGFSLRIIKADGTVDTVSLLTAVLVEDVGDVPSLFTPYFDKQNTIKDKTKSANIYFKLAVSNLEPGDIIDYCYTVYNDNDVSRMSSLEFDPIYYVCHREYPVVSQQFEINTDEKSYVNSKSINGAPEFRESKANGYNVFAWEDKDREKIKDTRWVNEYMVLPMLKFQIIYSKNNDAEDLFISDRGELKKSITPEELARKVNRIYEKMDASGGRKLTQDNIIANYTTSLLSNTEYLLRKGEAYDLGDEEFIKRVYYISRHQYGLYGNRLGSQYFAYVLLQKLRKKNIPAELIVTTSNSVTEMKDVIFGTELEWLVKAKNKFIFSFSANSNPFDLKDDFLENDAYVITLGKSPTATPIKLPGTTPDDNLNTTTIDAAMDERYENMKVTMVNTYKGIAKEDNDGPPLAYTNVYDNDYLSYYGDNEIDQLPEKKREEIERLMRAKREEFKKRKPEYMKRFLQNEFSNVVQYDNFLLITDGRTFNKQELKYSETFVLGDLTRKAGNNYLISIPALMGGQTQVKPEDRIRKYDLNVRNPRAYTWEISFAIPAGYTVKGLADLNISVENETGLFTSKAVVEGTILKLSIKKAYKQTQIKKEDFGKMLEFIDAAYDFSQRRILLKKG
jgi:hypothetical protein